MFRSSKSRVLKQHPKNPQHHDPSVYACECGKSYSNFPALYLHFQRKHSIKISTKRELSNCQVQLQNNQRIVTYFYTGLYNSSEQIVLERFREKWRKVIDDYEENLEEIQGNDWRSSLCLQNLKTFLSDQLFKIDENSNSKDMPYWFNRFLMTKKQGLSIGECKGWCQTLIQFSNWQYKNNHSSIIIEINDDFQF